MQEQKTHTKTKLDRNGDWDLLLDNCAFLDKQRETYPEFRIFYDFVVQVDNYKEMIPFIKLVQEFKPQIDIKYNLVPSLIGGSQRGIQSQMYMERRSSEHQ